MPDDLDGKPAALPDVKNAGFFGLLSTNAIGILTFTASLISVLVTWRTQTLVNDSNHAGAVTDQFVKNVTPLTAFFTSNKRGDEEAADIDLTALQDFAQTPDDQIALLTIAARKLNPTACRSDGEATARFVTALISRLKLEHSHGSELILKFVRSRGFLVPIRRHESTFMRTTARCGSGVRSATSSRPSNTASASSPKTSVITRYRPTSIVRSSTFGFVFGRLPQTTAAERLDDRRRLFYSRRA